MLKTVFRYPGGKTKLTKNILLEMNNMFDGEFLEDDTPNFTFVDVFVGGGAVALGVANEYPTVDIVINDLDEWMYCFWKELCSGNTQKLRYAITDHNPPNVKDFKHWRNKISNGDKLTDSEKAFLALFFNRTAFSGIFKSGPIGGFEQTGK